MPATTPDQGRALKRAALAALLEAARQYIPGVGPLWAGVETYRQEIAQATRDLPSQARDAIRAMARDLGQFLGQEAPRHGGSAVEVALAEAFAILAQHGLSDDELAAEAGLRPGPAEERAFFERLPQALQHLLAARGGAEALPGTQILLDAIVADPELLPGLVTGNIAECARIKLEACGINHSFFVGAFGRMHADRARIAAMAIEQARSLVADNGELEAEAEGN